MHPPTSRRARAEAAIDAGADIVIAHHPHLLDGMEAYHGGLIVYSLGNLVFSGFSGETAETVLVRAKVSEDRLDAQLIPVVGGGSGVPSLAKGAQADEHPAARQGLLGGARHEREDRRRQRVRAHHALRAGAAPSAGPSPVTPHS